MMYTVKKLKGKSLDCNCGNPGKFRYSVTGTHQLITVMCGACQSLWESMLRFNGLCTDPDCRKCNH